MIKDLNERSKQVRRDTLHLSSANGGYHYGGCFSVTEILIELYDNILKPRDRFILSKGHACWPMYVLLREKGMNPKLGGHPSLDLNNGIHFTTGSEGHGFPAGVGMALARKIKNIPGRIFVVVGDGECQEGTTWESLLMAAHHHLDNLTVIIDYNEFQGAGAVCDILPINGIDAIAREIGWSTLTIDGHNSKQIKDALVFTGGGFPRLILARTVKGKGVSFMEGRGEWHANFPDKGQMITALEDLK